MVSVSVFIDKLIALCPHCQGTLNLMALYDHPPELGGDWECDFILCMSCKFEWSNDTAPKEFSSADGEYWLTTYIAINGIGSIEK